MHLRSPVAPGARAALRRLVRASMLPAALGLLVTCALVACAGAPPPERQCTWPAPHDFSDCISRCLECGLRDYGPCLASCQGAQRGEGPHPLAVPGQPPGALEPPRDE